MFCAAIRTLNQCFVVCSLATNRHKESVGLQLLSGIWIQVKTLVRIGWQSTLIRVDVVTILTARVCHLCTKSFKPFYIAIAFGGILIARLCKFSTACGQYYVYFLLCMCRGEPLRVIVSRFSRDVVENDRAVAQFAYFR